MAEENFAKQKQEDLEHFNMFKYELCFEQLCLEDNFLVSEEAIVKFEEIYRREQTMDKRTVLKLKTLLSLKFVQENSVGSSYTKCLRNFLQTDSLVEIVEEEGGDDINLIFRSKEELFQLLWRHCRIETESQLKKLRQRAGFKLPPGDVEYKVLVYLKESANLKYPVKEVMELLREYRTRMGKKMRIDVFLPEVLDVLKLLNNKKLHEKSLMSVSLDNIIIASSHNGLNYLNSDLCVTEKDFLRQIGGSSDVTAAMAQVLNIIRKGVKNILLDWKQELVFVFYAPKDYNNFVKEVEKVVGEVFEKNPASPDIAVVPHQHLYHLVTPFKIDIRDFLLIDPDCRLSQDSREICSKNKTFPFMCFTDDLIMSKYSVKLSEKCLKRK